MSFARRFRHSHADAFQPPRLLLSWLRVFSDSRTEHTHTHTHGTIRGANDTRERWLLQDTRYGRFIGTYYTLGAFRATTSRRLAKYSDYS